MSELAWHFVGEKLRDGRPVPEDGEWLEHEGEIVWCQNGLYASRTPFDALGFAPGANLCLVECENIQKEDARKFVCRRRRILFRINATEPLLEFARWCANEVIHLWDAPDTVRVYLQTGNPSLALDSKHHALRGYHNATGASLLAAHSAWFASCFSGGIWHGLIDKFGPHDAARLCSDQSWRAISVGGLTHALDFRDTQRTKFAELTKAAFVKEGWEF